MPAAEAPIERAAAGRLALLRIGYAVCLAHDVGDLWQHAALWYGEPTWPMTAPAGVRWALGARWPLLFVGAGLHLGIVMFLPLPRFGLLMLVLLGVLAPIGRTHHAPDRPALRPDRPVLRRARALFHAWWVFAFALGLRGPWHAWRHGEDAPRRAPASRALHQAELWSYRLFGMRSHPIFLDSQFLGYDEETRVRYVPPEGGPPREFTPPRWNRHWVSWCYRMTWPRIPRERLEAWLRRYVAHHGTRAGLDLERGQVVVERRVLTLPIDGWRPGARAANLDSPWRAVAVVALERGALAVRWL